jgi:hypothetical protein
MFFSDLAKNAFPPYSAFKPVNWLRMPFLNAPATYPTGPDAAD